MSELGIVVIGRNEGERLRTCLASVRGRGAAVVYVDSGSTDGSVALARTFGAEVVELDLSIPFTAARARNAGLERLLALHADVQFVQFVDGDCELAPGWLDSAVKELHARPGTAVVFGRLRERHPEASVYNRLCDLEWNLAPTGEVAACGGIALMRAAALQQVGAFDPGVLAGEEPELCLRLRRAGWKVLRIAGDMGWHDAAMTRAGQWWKRAVRCGFAYAQGANRHGRGPERHYVRECCRAAVWGGVVPAVAVLLAWPTGGWSLLAGLYYPLAAARAYRGQRRRGVAPGLAAPYGVSCALARFPEFLGVCKYALDRLRRRPVRLIEYK